MDKKVKSESLNSSAMPNQWQFVGGWWWWLVVAAGSAWWRIIDNLVAVCIEKAHFIKN